MASSHASSSEGLTFTVWSFLFFGFGMLSIGLFQTNQFFPLWLSVAVMSVVGFYVVCQVVKKWMGLVMATLFLAYLLPFVHLPEYLWYDFSGPEPLFGFGHLLSNPYMFDETTIRLTAMLGATGALGMAFACSLFASPCGPRRVERQSGLLTALKTMSLRVWLLWVLIGLLFSSMAAPAETIFTSSYTTVVSYSDSINFGSSWLISYIILSFAAADALVEHRATDRKIKRWLISIVVVYVFVWLQLLRGDRAAIPFVFALTLARLFWVKDPNWGPSRLAKWLGVGLCILVLCVLGMIIGVARLEMVDANLKNPLVLIGNMWSDERYAVSGLLNGTWSAVLLTPLSVAGDHLFESIAPRWGSDYVNLLLSTPPGFVADAIGWERPIGIHQGPAWEMRYGSGGTHAVVLPFRNFGMLGVFVIPTLWTFAICRVERRCLRSCSVGSLSLLMSITLVSPHWLWYGEKNMVTCLIAWFVLSRSYRVCLPKVNADQRPAIKGFGIPSFRMG